MPVTVATVSTVVLVKPVTVVEFRLSVNVPALASRMAVPPPLPEPEVTPDTVMFWLTLKDVASAEWLKHKVAVNKTSANVLLG